MNAFPAVSRGSSAAIAPPMKDQAPLQPLVDGLRPCGGDHASESGVVAKAIAPDRFRVFHGAT